MAGIFASATTNKLSDVPNPVTTLSEKDVYLLKNSWDIVRRDYQNHAVRYFQILYKENPKMIARLPAFNGVAAEDIGKNKKALAHAVTTLSSIDNLIINSSDSGCLAALLVKFGKNHIKWKVYKEDFKRIPELVGLFAKEAIGSVWNADIEKAWTKFLIYMVNGSFDFLD